MIQASLYIPRLDNDGAPLDAIHARVEQMLAHAFGGYTAHNAIGGWYADGADHPGTEEVIRYDVLTDDGGGERDILRVLAKYVKREAKQDAVLLTFSPIEMDLI